MIGLLLIILLILCIYIAKNLLENDPMPLNGRYSVPGRWYELKKITFIILYHSFRWTNWKDNHEFALERKNLVTRRRGEEEIYIGTGGLESRELQSLLGSNLEQMEYLPNLLNHPQATDAVHFMGFSETDKTLFMLSIGQRPKGLCEIWLFLRVDGIGIFESPVQLDALVSAESEKCWRGGGLKLECLESHRRWHISFNGLLRKPHKWNEEGEEFLHVKFGFIWSAFSSVFDFKNDIHPCALAQGFANEKWNRQFAVNLAMFQQQLSHYEQWGQFVGDLEIEGHEKKELPLRGPKSRLSGIWNWSVIYRYVAFIVHFETGISVHLLCISFQNSITHMNIGYVTFPNGKKAGISWSDASLADIADDGIIENIYQIKFTSDGKHYNLTVKVDKSVCPVQDTGLDWEGKIYNYTADYRLNVITRGSGLIQLYYLNENGRQVPDLVPVERFQEPVVPACSKLVLAFSDEACQCAKVVGGKGAQLAQLTKMQKRFECQFSVPKGLCVTIEALKFQMRVDNSLQEAVAELNNVACTIKKGNLQELCNRCIELFRGTKLAPEIESAIRDQLAELKLLGTEERLAIRSSAAGEDTEDSSAAGQLSTELGLKGFDQVCDAVRKCWASLYSFQAVQYRRQRGQPVPSNMGVVIQQMVAAQTAGVMFTCDPLTGHPGRLIINANYGLGESVVSGSVMPDTIILSHSRNGSCQIIKEETGSKKQQVVQALEGGVVYENTITSQTTQCCISEESILQLGQVALQIQKFLGNSKDIEWAIKDTHIYLLQARPVTTLDAPSEFELMHEFDSPFPTDYAWITNTNVGEVFPGAATPLTLSTFVKAIDYASW
ncbi:uncharacterized protein LOC127577460 [Pristis pectinata]|uniref:uncharacterized protein LOC127577460 n=1 Tax=Pristis pectinata TaxID=685728 RepID=UPI00223DBE4D|nr:uncharacterized protein LOC127577460 [Pristis pectinata]